MLLANVDEKKHAVHCLSMLKLKLPQIGCVKIIEETIDSVLSAAVRIVFQEFRHMGLEVAKKVNRPVLNHNFSLASQDTVEVMLVLTIRQ